MESSKPDLPNLLKEHALGKQMLNDDPEAFARDLVLDIPVPDRAENFTTGTCKEAFVPSILVSRKTRTMLAVFFIGAGATGHRGFVHGGVLATILDECCGRAAQSQFEAVKLARATSQDEKSFKSAAVTAQLSISYLAPVPTNSCVMVQAIVDDDQEGTTAGISARKARVTAKLWRLSAKGRAQSEDDVLCAEAQSFFIEPKQAIGD